MNFELDVFDLSIILSALSSKRERFSKIPDCVTAEYRRYWEETVKEIANVEEKLLQQRDSYIKGLVKESIIEKGEAYENRNIFE